MGHSKSLFGANGTVRGAGSSTSIPDRLLNEHEAAEILGLSVKTLRRWRWAREGVAWIKLGSAVRYAPADLQAFTEAGRQLIEAA
jgi:hypothetical protein